MPGISSSSACTIEREHALQADGIDCTDYPFSYFLGETTLIEIIIGPAWPPVKKVFNATQYYTTEFAF
ncbi:hypothetical protein TRAPUB_2707 [Trametes pubescens]|uniref:Uncharacterized protein n=1 Tax=Trametes pubescens TaxID=154538 RepID=A0A1M2VFP7_TRAPU|nr:hypothetical protein TRAPUB_2707 [Trametes pubescens]